MGLAFVSSTVTTLCKPLVAGLVLAARYEDNGCTDTRPYTADLDQLRPESARRTAVPSTPSSSSSSTAAVPASHGGNGTLVGLVVAGLLVGSALAAIAWRVRHRGDPVVE